MEFKVREGQDSGYNNQHAIRLDNIHERHIPRKSQTAKANCIDLCKSKRLNSHFDFFSRNKISVQYVIITGKFYPIFKGKSILIFGKVLQTILNIQLIL